MTFANDQTYNFLMENTMTSTLSLFNPIENATQKFFHRYPLAEQWNPKINLSESQSHYYVEAELPGIKKEDLKVSFDNNILSISGERSEKKDDKEKNYHRIESVYGKFNRSISFDNDIQSENIEAEYKDGILSIAIAKKAEVKPKLVEIK